MCEERGSKQIEKEENYLKKFIILKLKERKNVN